VDEALVESNLADPGSAKRCFSMMWGARFTLRTGIGSCQLVLLEGCGSLWWDVVVGRRAVSLDFLALLFP